MSTAPPIEDRAAAAPRDRKPDPGPGEHRVCRAALAFSDADKALREHHGSKSGVEYDAKVATWREAYQALLKSAASYRGATHAGNQG